jgi:hypothetical protein
MTHRAQTFPLLAKALSGRARSRSASSQVTGQPWVARLVCCGWLVHDRHSKSESAKEMYFGFIGYPHPGADADVHPCQAPERFPRPLFEARFSGRSVGGLGGFVDGIVFHQILQWHHMVSDVSRYPMNTIPGLEVNTLADGFFHLATWVLVLAASIAAITAWRQGRLAPNWSFHFGLVLTGWGIFTSRRG